MQHVAPPSNSIKSTRDVITWHAYMSGLKAGSVTGMVAGTAVLSANAYWPAFRTRLGVSGKTALALMPAMAVFSFVSENRMLAGARNPQMYLASTNPNFVELRVPKQSSLMMYVPACRQLLVRPPVPHAGDGGRAPRGRHLRVPEFEHVDPALAADHAHAHLRADGGGGSAFGLDGIQRLHEEARSLRGGGDGRRVERGLVRDDRQVDSALLEWMNS